jgi:hypothetical protein
MGLRLIGRRRKKEREATIEAKPSERGFRLVTNSFFSYRLSEYYG